MPPRFNLFLRTRSRVTGAAINPRVNQLETLINKQELRSALASLRSQTQWTRTLRHTHFRFDCSAFKGGRPDLCAVIGGNVSPVGV